MTPIFRHRLEVRFRDCDPLGHVNNAVYLTYLEQARFSHWRALGMALNGDEASSLATGSSAATGIPGVILARVEIDYRRPAKFGDALDITIGMAAIGRTSFTYEYEISDAAGLLVASARSVLVSFDYAANKPVPVPDPVREALARNLLQPSA